MQIGVEVTGPERWKSLVSTVSFKLNSVLLVEVNGPEGGLVLGANTAEVNSKSKDWVVVVDGAVVGVLGVWQNSIGRECVSDYYILARLVGQVRGVCGHVVPVSVLGLILDLGECELCLAVNTVVRNTIGLNGTAGACRYAAGSRYRGTARAR